MLSAVQYTIQHLKYSLSWIFRVLSVKLHLEAYVFIMPVYCTCLLTYSGGATNVKMV